jgi:hypothetical protein
MSEVPESRRANQWNCWPAAPLGPARWMHTNVCWGHAWPFSAEWLSAPFDKRIAHNPTTAMAQNSELSRESYLNGETP